MNDVIDADKGVVERGKLNGCLILTGADFAPSQSAAISKEKSLSSWQRRLRWVKGTTVPTGYIEWHCDIEALTLRKGYNMPLTPLKTGALSRTTELELACKVPQLTTLRSAVDSGVDSVYISHRCIAGRGDFATDCLNRAAFEREVRYARDEGTRIVISVEEQSASSTWKNLREVLDRIAQLHVDAIMLSDPALLMYMATQHSRVPRYLALPEWATDVQAVTSLHRQSGIERIIMPRVVFLPQLEYFLCNLQVEIELIGFGKNCTFVDGEPAVKPSFKPKQEFRIEVPVNQSNYHPIEAKACCDALELLPRLKTMGVHAVRIEADDRGTNSVPNVARIWREAIDDNAVTSYQGTYWLSTLGKRAPDSGNCDSAF